MTSQDLTFVLREGIYYPSSNDDHDVLSALRIPITRVDSCYLPLLKSVCKSRMIKIKVLHFADLEEAMIAKVKAKWKHDLDLKRYAPKSKSAGSEAEVLTFTFVYPHKKNITVDAMLEGIRRWYRGHGIRLEIVTKKTPKNNKLIIHKVAE